MTHSIYFASTLLHLYTSASIALSRPDEAAHLVFIDQPESDEFPLFNIVQQWSLSPFKTTHLFYGRFKGLQNKLKKRKDLFKTIEQLVTDIKPAHIFVGNDRRIEFQYSMHVTRQLHLKTTGHYMDEGTFTYVGRHASSRLGDAIIDNSLKKLSYGFWWKNPKTVGESSWIQDIHVAFPDEIHKLLRKKNIHQLDSSYFTCDALVQLSERLMQYYQLNTEELLDLDALFTLPHESLFEKQPQYRDLIIDIVCHYQQNNKKIAVKYHPRNSAPDVLNLQASGATLLPASVSFEAMLPLLQTHTQILGDISSTLLMAKWLRPELKVTSYQIDQSTSVFNQLFKSIGISIQTRVTGLHI